MKRYVDQLQDPAWEQDSRKAKKQQEAHKGAWVAQQPVRLVQRLEGCAGVRQLLLLWTPKGRCCTLDQQLARDNAMAMHRSPAG